jgi:hypothetical protein
MPTNYLQGVKPASDSVSDAYAKAAAIVSSAAGGFRDREVEQYKLEQAEKDRADRLAQQALDNKRAQAMLDMAQEKHNVEKSTLAANQDYANRLQNVLSGEGAYDESTTKSMSDAYMNTLAKTNSESEAMKALSAAETAGKKAILADPTRLKAVAGSTSWGGEGNIDIKDQLALKNNMFAPLDAKEKQINEDQKWKTQLDFDKYKFGAQLSQSERHHRDTMNASKVKAPTETQMIKGETVAAIATNLYNGLSPKDKASYIDLVKQKKYNTPQEAYLAYHTVDISNAANKQLGHIKTTPEAKTLPYGQYVDGTKYGNTGSILGRVNELKDLKVSDKEIAKLLSNQATGTGIIDWGLPDMDLDYLDDLIEKKRALIKK